MAIYTATDVYYVDSSLPAHNMSFKSKVDFDWILLELLLDGWDVFSLNIINCHVTKLKTSNLEVDPSK